MFTNHQNETMWCWIWVCLTDWIQNDFHWSQGWVENLSFSLVLVQLDTQNWGMSISEGVDSQRLPSSRGPGSPGQRKREPRDRRRLGSWCLRPWAQTVPCRWKNITIESLFLIRLLSFGIESKIINGCRDESNPEFYSKVQNIISCCSTVANAIRTHLSHMFGCNLFHYPLDAIQMTGFFPCTKIANMRHLPSA